MANFGELMDELEDENRKLKDLRFKAMIGEDVDDSGCQSRISEIKRLICEALRPIDPTLVQRAIILSESARRWFDPDIYGNTWVENNSRRFRELWEEWMRDPETISEELKKPRK